MPIGIDILNSITYDVSILSASMNRHTSIISSLHNWLFFPVKEIVIIDWCSYTVLDDIIPTYLKELPEFKKVKIYRVDGFSKWVLSWAFNLGLSLATSEYILKLDAEVVITHPCFFEINEIKPNLLVRGDWAKSHTKYLNGSFYCKKEHLDKVGYYNERIVTYGWDDSDLYNRLIHVGLEEKLILCLDHIEHSDYIRTAYTDQEICLKSEIQKNRILSDSYPTLRYDKERYEQIDDRRFKIIKTEFQVATHVKKLKTILFSEDKFVVLKVFNGFGNRLRALLSTLEFAGFFGYKVYVIWEITHGFDHSHFEEYFQLSDFLKVTFISSDKLEAIHNFDIKIYHVMTDKQILTDYDPSYKKIYIELSNYIVGAFDFKNTFELKCSYFKYLKPSKHIENIVNYIKENIIGGKYNIFHIRRGDAVKSKFKHNYCVSSIYLFAKYINMSDKINVVLSDDYDYCTKFLDVLCPNKFIIINKTNLNKNKTMYEAKYGINMDAVDFFLFRDAEKIYGTHWSSFSYVACHIFNKTKNYIIVKDSNKFGLFKYDKSLNIGDLTQSRAVERYLPFVTKYIDRDSLGDYKGEKINLIMAGWFLHNRECYTKKLFNEIVYCNCDKSPENISWPPAEKIDPLFFSFNISNNRVITSEENISYLNAHSPIGCRDLSTYRKLQNLNIESYFSYCITLSMKHDNIVKIPKQALVIDVPVDKIDNDIKQNYNIIYMENTFSDEEMGLSIEEKFAKCDDMITKVISSEIVITSRLHVLTVCLANGVRVQFVGNEHTSDKDSCYYSKNRYEGVTDLIDNPELISVVQKQIENNIISSIYNKYYKNAAV